EFKQLDLRRLRRALAFPLLVDGRNIYEPDAMTRLGFIYCGIGRGQPVHYPPDQAPAANGHVAPSATPAR
ncbi:MAG TPA: hypothetical protein VK066_29665, partial [Chloroflexota bacterium]|nr:hypothetical protein [Chloroflexota bacterium]